MPKKTFTPEQIVGKRASRPSPSWRLGSVVFANFRRDAEVRAQKSGS
jgi:hypothetical protein